ncbi:S4 domain-containing protein YaaA [Streptococcus suis]|uniref:S4 domain-containing protein YaaA n=1 Tax=Streptococcus suis TaxID=1307 RepID=UPI00192D96A4|nr:S4 domain-containing protein YaaA [Streptococcus suis]MBL6504820.1 S4 domain-containing protein YaaA [Streptococcus suis]MBM0242359.1 S4 domain-containing protein YaaA [Streptococcus suis]MBM7205124.1 S4 domain-containing protein YaaA [Streptococcus suis]MBM7282656.1 S4 domain-containing protein YaaA [Streptococcus suis]MBO4116626.1 S4 domain-containing protein YaaA [Streptococcus suis]
MEFKLFDDYITLQALLKTTGILHSGGAIKGFLEENTILFNGKDEKRRGKKIRVGDVITLPDHNTSITIVVPSAEEIQQHQEDQAEKERVAAIVKKLNQENKKNKKQVKTPKKATKKTERKPVRFPGM